MVIKNKDGVLILFSLVIFLFLSFNLVSAACWQHTAQSTCNADTASNCNWRNDTWGSWCEETNCWSFYNQSGCNAASITGKTCSWKAGSVSYGCEKVNCWGFSGTNQTQCQSNSKGLSCEWNAKCYNSGTGTSTSSVSCYSITNQTTCQSTTGCSWGECYEKGCWSGYNTNSTYCTSLKGWNGKACKWEASTSNCNENACWRFGANESYCGTANSSGLNCEWKWNYCQDKGCWSFDYTNESACQNNNLNLSCTWNNNFCNMKDCYSYSSNQTSCEAKSECKWTAWYSAGWCQETNCWTYDSYNAGNKTTCEAALGGGVCNWTGITTGNTTSGWCYKDSSATKCSSLTTQKACSDTYYCWWQYNNMSNAASGGNCKDPGNFSGVSINTSIFDKWNPGCYIFGTDSCSQFNGNSSGCSASTLGCSYNSTSTFCNATIIDCNKVIGCNWTGTSCAAVDENSSIINVTSNYTLTNGINCSYINDSQMCNKIPTLSNCCSWQNGTCAESKFTTSCYDQMEQTPEGASFCEDYNAYNNEKNCLKISGFPWYMPCTWNSTSEKCGFKGTDVFGGGSQSLVKINNKKNCEAAGGKWVTENYCEGNISVPSGRCEYKFDEESNCDKACFACETKGSGGVAINSSNAEAECEASALGICEFSKDSKAPNTIGYCKAKEQFKKGIAGSCDSNCGDCSFKGDKNNNDTTKRPSYYCANSKANSDGGGCKWITDNSTVSGGYCTKKGEKTCEDACDRCYSQSDCQNLGRTVGNLSSGSCKWDGDSTSGSCVLNIDGSSEICWDGVDNDNDNLIDCADSFCYSDSYCGFVSGDCFGWSTNTTCINNGCEWVSDKWGSWCDFNGSRCWNYNQNESSCEGSSLVLNESLSLTSARLANNNINNTYYFNLSKLGSGWVLGSISIRYNSTNVVLGTDNYTINYVTQRINFSNNTFMVSGGGITNLTNVTYKYYSRQQRTCSWKNDSYSTGWCENDWSLADSCMSLNRTACNAAIGSGCNWTVDTWCSGSGNSSSWCDSNGGWCEYSKFKSKNCWSYSNSSSCGGINGCSWKTDQYSIPHCEIDWSSNCWLNSNSSTCGAQSSCQWRTSSWGGWCDVKMGECWSQLNQSSCSDLSTKCYWQNWSSGGGSCQPLCSNSSITSSSCNTISGCTWKEENGWCQESGGCWNYNQTGCTNSTGQTAGCRWKESGWCDPTTGFSTTSTTSSGSSGGGSGGGDCWKYDGNQSSCTNKTLIGISCSWSAETNAQCEVNWGGDCWQYNSTDFGCNATNGCWWNPGYGGNGWCSDVMDQCWSNSTLKSNSTECNSNANCDWNSQWNSCEPACLNSTLKSSSSLCNANSACKYKTGWCNPSLTGEMFTGMEAGAPLPIAFDACPDSGIQPSVDLCGFGMKDMGDSYGFGASVSNFQNASACNKEKLSSFVVGLSSGFQNGSNSTGQDSFFGGGGFGNEKTGTGNDTVKLFVYLDTDGLTTGGCTTHNSSAVGYEFRLKYSVIYNSSSDKVVETFNVDKCDSGTWEATDIKLSAWRKKMCSEIGGPMIAIKKDDLAKYPSLYDSTKDMRIYVSTSGNTGNVSSPLDTAGPGYTTPGSVDFDISNAFAYGADSTKFEDILKNGFVKGEDCFVAGDEDGDNSSDCVDYDCQFSPKCSGYSYTNDTRSPSVVGVKIEEYPDAALIMYDTSKPTNGSLLFYKNDSQCLTLNATVFDSTNLSGVRDHVLWHDADLYSGTLGYNLVANTTYYYKLKVCDAFNKCAISKCSSFITSTTGDCGYCDFVTRIKAPDGWTVSYDLDEDGTYEHIQGEVCGPNAGMKTNYSTGRRANVKFAKSDGTSYIEFLNVTLSKTGLNDKVRTISTSGDVISSSGIVGLTSETRDKIINNLHPEYCRIKIPKASDASCTTLYHCDDSGNNCVDLTSAAGGAPLDSVNCIWAAPFCEFSTYKMFSASSSSSTTTGSGGGGGGGGGGAATNKTTSNASSTPSSTGSEETSTTDKEEVSSGSSEDKGEIEDIVGKVRWGVVAGALMVVLAIVGVVVWKFVGKKRKYY